MLAKDPAAIDWVRDAFRHLKVIGYVESAKIVFEKAGLADSLDEGVVSLSGAASVERLIDAAKKQRVWDRETRLGG